MNQVQAGSGDLCEARWREKSGQFVNVEQPDYRGLLSFWEQQASDCSGTGAYEARLAAIYVQLNELERAHAALAAARKHPAQYTNLIELVELTSESFALAGRAGTSKSKSQLDEFGQRVLAFAKRYPEFPEGLAFAGGVQTTLGHHADALPLLEKAFTLADKGISKTGLYRNAAVSYAALGKYSQAFDAAGAAVSEKKALMADPEFMYAVIKTQAELGMFEQAKQSILVLVAKAPAVKADPEFRELVESLKLKFEAAKG
jgi:tetratricopeptide (TPR) repeat protein